ncbi:S26 family signal peptidase [Halohasta salina]|uniref:S26 family signal peptidase n=1 Tax=Halohasta salina TaxID=2961621 RepID=UPI0020A3493D|nr:S26 family signal peptidase [Halohasta salina]
MGVSSTVQRAITVVLVGIAAVMVIGELLGQPFLLGYIATGSMEPTLGVGDGFVAMPPLLAGEIDSGDVVTFEAQSIDGGGPTTHRVIDQTAQGYITQGDANSFTDQDAGEPPVTDAQIYAVVLQVDGEVVALPSIGHAALFVQSGFGSVIGLLGLDSGARVGAATTGFGVVLITVTLLYGFVTDDAKRPTSRSTRRDGVISGRLVVIGLVVMLSLPVLTGMVLPSGMTTTNLLSADPSVADGQGRVPAGETEELSVSVENEGVVPKVVIVEPVGDGIDIDTQQLTLETGERASVTMRVDVPVETGPFARSYTEHHYFHVLPLPVIGLLAAIHPYLPMITIAVLSTTPVVAVYAVVVGIRPITMRSTQR